VKLAFDSSSHAHSDKSAFNYQLALENVTDVVIRSNDVENTSVLDPVLQLQHVLVPLTVDVQQLEEGNEHVDSGGLVVAAAGNSNAIKSHPFVTVIHHRCPIITKDLEVIQQALVVYKYVDEEGFTTVVYKSNRKKQKGYQIRSNGPLTNLSQ
jgi:hypothetical protein